MNNKLNAKTLNLYFMDLILLYVYTLQSIELYGSYDQTIIKFRVGSLLPNILLGPTCFS